LQDKNQARDRGGTEQSFLSALPTCAARPQEALGTTDEHRKTRIKNEENDCWEGRMRGICKENERRRKTNKKNWQPPVRLCYGFCKPFICVYQCSFL
jgi:hypothetical protein